MNKNIEVIIAGALGLFAMVGIVAVRKIIKERTYNSEYADTHKLFAKKSSNFTEHGDGIEINAML